MTAAVRGQGDAASRILGIDPGSRITGFGVIDMIGHQPAYVASGCIRTDLTRPVAERLLTIFDSIRALVAEHRPTAVAVEQVFVHRNPDSALKLGQARGVAICAAAQCGLPVAEYAPALIKQSVVGTGRASKEQVQHMMCALLKLAASPQADAADALAVAVCHGHVAGSLLGLGAKAGRSTGRRRGWR